MNTTQIPQLPVALFVLIIFLVIWEMAWKGIAMWKAGRNGQLQWFVATFLLNTIGILPIVYLSFFQKKQRLN